MLALARVLFFIIAFTPFATAQQLPYDVEAPVVEAPNLVVMNSMFADDVVVCNAGLVHPAAEKAVCYRSNSDLACDPKDEDLSSSCLCHANQPGGDSLTTNTGMGLSIHDTTSLQATADADPRRNTLFGNMWEGRMQSLQFNLASERFGARYFVDFCYRGPIQVLENLPGGGTKDITVGNYFLDTQGTMSDLLAADEAYAISSGLMISTEIRCDLRMRGVAMHPRGVFETFPFFDMKDPDFYFSTQEVPVDQAVSLQTWLNRAFVDVPRFCSVRFFFSETRSDRLRKWHRGAAEVNIRLNVVR